jgi:hypothetical protein
LQNHNFSVSRSYLASDGNNQDSSLNQIPTLKPQKTMPHFVLDCSENIIKLKSPTEIMQIVFDTAEATELFDKGDIKVRISPFVYFNTANSSNDFIHVFAYIMEG